MPRAGGTHGSRPSANSAYPRIRRRQQSRQFVSRFAPSSATRPDGSSKATPFPVGATVKTGADTSVELRLKPNGTLIKLAKLTTFRVEGLATPQKDQNGFTLVAGKIRAVAAKGSQYEIYTANTVAGVRGTDFSMSFEEGAKALLLVAKGDVEFGRRGAEGIAGAIMVNAGQFADFFGTFVPLLHARDVSDAEYGDMADRPGHACPRQADEPRRADEPKPRSGHRGRGPKRPRRQADRPARRGPAAEAFVAWLREPWAWR